MVRLEGQLETGRPERGPDPRTRQDRRQGCPVSISRPGPAPCHACHRQERFSGAWGAGNPQTLSRTYPWVPARARCLFPVSGSCSFPFPANPL